MTIDHETFQQCVTLPPLDHNLVRFCETKLNHFESKQNKAMIVIVRLNLLWRIGTN